ncbi:MAG: leucine-rich repeat domain-containing protein [Simkaniaceae bacterium]|nr:leucine-rich repeat domain-containing protein [Simkaniaceae bacterium]
MAAVNIESIPSEVFHEILKCVDEPKVTALVCRHFRDATWAIRDCKLKQICVELGADPGSEAARREAQGIFNRAVLEYRHLLQPDEDYYTPLPSPSIMKYLAIIKDPSFLLVKKREEYKFYKNLHGYLAPQDATLEALKQMAKERISKEALLNGPARDDQLHCLPDDLTFLSDLRVMALANNNIKIFPRDTYQLSSLRSLVLSRNNMDVFPKEICSLTSLKNLSLSRNNLKDIPREIRGLTSLEGLYLDGNKLETLPAEIGNLTSLKNLFLDRNKLEKLPVEMILLTSLEGLYLKITKEDLAEVRMYGIDLSTVPDNDSIDRGLEELILGAIRLNPKERKRLVEQFQERGFQSEDELREAMIPKASCLVS